MKDMVVKNIYDHGLIDEKDRVLVALSGGPDSVFLFYILMELKKELDFSLYIAHVNHGIRGKEALKDQRFVEGLAEKYNIPFYLKRADMDGYAREHNLSSEEAGREIRYGFFNEILEEIGGGKVALGHNKSDQVETLMMRFFRGTGIDGLRGMEYKTGNIIRPILNIRREDLEAYLEEEGIGFRIDHTNLQAIYSRNRMRLETLPHIEEFYNPNVIETVFKSSDNYKEDSDFLREYTEDVFSKIGRVETCRVVISRRGFLDQHRSIRSRILRMGIEHVKGNLQGLSQQHILDSLDFIDSSDSGKMIDLIEGINIMLSYDDIVIGRELDFSRAEYIYDIGGSDTFIEDLSLDIALELVDGENFSGNLRNPYIKYFDYDKIKGRLKIRNRRRGDVFTPLGMGGRSKKIKDFFIDEKIPREERDQVLLLTDEEDIIWVIGHRISDKHKLDEDTRKILRVEITRRI